MPDIFFLAQLSSLVYDQTSVFRDLRAPLSPAKIRAGVECAADPLKIVLSSSRWANVLKLASNLPQAPALSAN